MSYQSLYRRFRPQRFGEVRGQEHLVRALSNAVAEDRVGHAYLLSGPRGTGKTTTARILAKALNCPNLTGGEPCGECESCLSIEAGRSFDLQELDAASNRGIGEMKSLLETVALGTPGRTKVYILDEVHMLTKEASAALLKTLEEPPPHVVFVLATTDPQKVLPTIRSRAQHFELHLLAATDLRALLDDVVAEAGLEVGPEQIEYALRRGGGSARDTLSMLDQVAAAGSAPETAGALEHLVDAVLAGDAGGALAGVQESLVAGREPRVLGEQLLDELRDAFLVSQHVPLGHRSEAALARAEAVGGQASPRTLTRAMEILGEALIDMRQAPDPRVPLEVALLRIARPEAEESLAAVLQRLDRLERALAAGALAPGDAAEHPGGAPVTGSVGPSASTPAGDPGGSVGDGDEVDPPPAADPGGSTRASDGSGTGSTVTTTATGGAPGQRGGPADQARQVLAERNAGVAAAPQGPGPVADPPAEAPTGEPHRSSAGTGAADRPALGAHRSGAEGAARPAAGKRAGVTAGSPTGGRPAGPAAEPGPKREPGPAAEPAEAPVDGTPADGLPTRDELVLAWGDAVLPGLKQRTRVRWAPGRFVDVTGEAALFGLSNQITCDRCADQRAEVEAALADHFGRPVPVQLVVDEGAGAPSSRTNSGEAGAGPAGGSAASGSSAGPGSLGEIDEELDSIGALDELENADDTGDGVARLTEAFPGARLVDPPSA
jgi:DNA polymerase III subunit gamma/tau